MRNILVALMITCMLPLQALADCDFSTGITKVEQGYLYTKECHIKVGEMKRDLGIAQEQNKKLTQAITLKDLAITKADERAQLWQDTSFKLEARIETMDSIYKRNKWLYFGLGILATSAAVYAAGQLNHR